MRCSSCFRTPKIQLPRTDFLSVPVNCCLLDICVICALCCSALNPAPVFVVVDVKQQPVGLVTTITTTKSSSFALFRIKSINRAQLFSHNLNTTTNLTGCCSDTCTGYSTWSRPAPWKQPELRAGEWTRHTGFINTSSVWVVKGTRRTVVRLHLQAAGMRVSFTHSCGGGGVFCPQRSKRVPTSHVCDIIVVNC